MAVLLSDVRFRTAVIRPIDYGSFLRPPLGGPIQRINRLGNRYAIDVEMPPLREEPEGRLFTAKLEQALSEGALFAFPQPGLRIPPMGTPVVDGAVTSGNSLPIRGLTANVAIRAGQYLSIVHDSRRYIYRSITEEVADALGDVTLTLATLLRTPLADGDTVELSQPIIEGWIEPPEWQAMLEPFTATRFTITEAA